MNILDAINKIKETIGFDSFQSSAFIESHIVYLLGGTGTKQKEHFDCVLNSGVKIEIKSSKLIEDKRKKRAGDHIYFEWTKFNGVNNKKIGKFDYLLLVGYKERYYIWVIPANKVIKNSAELDINQIRSRCWINEYFVGDEKDMIRYFERIE